MAFVTSDGANIFLDLAGDGTPLLLLHGLGMDHRQWEPQWSAFVDGHQTFRLDLRGHGRSAVTPRGYTHAAMARDVQRVMVQIGMDRLNPGFIVAHSLSADAALQAALAEPRALRGVVVASPAVWGHDWSAEWLALWRSMREDARERGAAAAFERFRRDALFDGVRDRPETWQRILEMQAQCSGAPLVHGERDEGPSTLERLAGCKVPVLVLGADGDREDFKAAAREVVAAAPGAALREVAGSGHFANLEAPAAFTTAVLEFIASRS